MINYSLLRKPDPVKVRNPKPEIRKKSEIRQAKNGGILRISTFGFLSTFGFWTSGFGGSAVNAPSARSGREEFSRLRDRPDTPRGAISSMSGSRFRVCRCAGRFHLFQIA